MSQLIKINKQVGQTLIAAASEKAREEERDAVIENCKQIITDRETADEWARRNRRAAEFCDKKLKAIEKGKFSVYRGQIIFKDTNLNQSMAAFLNSEASKL